MAKESTRGPGRPKLPANERNVIMAISLPPEIASSLEAVAAAEGMPRSKLVAELIKRPLANRAKRAKQ